MFRGAEREDGGGHFSESIERGCAIRWRQKSEVDDAAGAREKGVRERGLIGEDAQVFEKRGDVAGKKADSENGGKRGGFEKKRNGLA